MPDGDQSTGVLDDVRQGTGPGNPPPPPTDAAAGLGTSQPPPLPATRPPVVTVGSAPPPEVQHDDRLEQLKGDSFGTKVYHGILNALGGSQDISYSIDPNTGQMVQHTAASGPGTQWKRIISGALTGYAAGAGLKGPGSTAAKFGAGIQAGQQQAQQQETQQKQQATEDFERQQKLATTTLQRSLLTQQVTEATFRNTRNQVDAAEHDMDNMNKFHDLIAAGGAGTRNMGHFDSPEAVRAAFENDPTLHDSHAQGRIISIPHVNEDGKIQGVDAAFVTADWLNAKYQKDLPVTVNGWKDGKPTTETFTIPGGSISNDKASQIIMSQGKDSMDQHDKKFAQEQEAKKTTSQVNLQGAEAREHRATTAKTEFETQYGREHGEFPGTEGKGGGLIISPEDMPATVKAVGEGRVSLQTLGRMLAKNPTLAEEITKVYPDFREGNVKTADKQQLEFTSGKTGGSLNASGTSVQHLTQLLALNTAASHIPGTPAYREYMIQVHQAAEELSKFYGGGKAAQSDIHQYESDLGGIGPGRDRALTRAVTALGEKMTEYHQQWQNAMPSKYWTLPMPGISQTADDQLARISPEYAAQRKTWAQPTAPTATPQQSPVNTPATPQRTLPPEAVQQLKLNAGRDVTFNNGQIWRLDQAGQPMYVGQANNNAR